MGEEGSGRGVGEKTGQSSFQILHCGGIIRIASNRACSERGWIGGSTALESSRALPTSGTKMVVSGRKNE